MNNRCVDDVEGVLCIRPPARAPRPLSLATADEDGAMTFHFRSPTTTAVTRGAGFSAGVLSIRGLVALAAGTTLLLGSIRLLERVIS
jgi:hypothetical protein